MKVQIVSTRYIVQDGKRRRSYSRGDEVELSKAEAERAIEKGYVRRAGAEGELPPPNAGAAITAPTQPDGTPLETDADGNPLTEGALTMLDPDWQAPATHKDADAQAAELGISFPKGAKVTEKADAIRAVLEAKAAGEAAPTTEALHELADEELIQRAIDYGHSEEEVVELSHDELVTFVAEAMNRQTADPAEQVERTAELAAQRDADEE